jgi:dTDP-4-dehydrorhamnose 3,5-epimerase
VRQLETRLDGPILIEPAVFGDDRGFFHESFRTDAYADLGVRDVFVQDNHSRSSEAVLRGIHFQFGAGQAKLVRCGRGAIWDVVVDLRQGSPTYGEWEGHRLDDENLHQLYCPIGFGHGFVVLSDVADVLYKCSSYYDGSIERGIAWDDPDVGIEWPVAEPVLSERDRSAPRLKDVAAELPFRWPG